MNSVSTVFKSETLLNVITKLSNCHESFVVEENTCYIEVRGNFAVGQCKPDESQTHTESSRHVSKIVTFTWNRNVIKKMCIFQKLTVFFNLSVSHSKLFYVDSIVELYKKKSSKDNFISKNIIQLCHQLKRFF